MLVQRCKESFSLEITLQEPSGKQHNVTVFPKTLESFYQKKNKIIQIDELEDEMLEFHGSQSRAFSRERSTQPPLRCQGSDRNKLHGAGSLFNCLLLKI